MRCQRRKKMDVVERFGGECKLCGYKRCINALEFHHLEDKQEAPSYIIMRWSWERAKKELEKCIMVCANCHRELHYIDKNIDPINLAPPSWRVHNCHYCQKEYETRNEKQKFCSQVCVKRHQSKPERPDKEELRHLIRTLPQRRVALMLNVSQSTIRKWCNNYGIDMSEACRSFTNPEWAAAKKAKLDKPKGVRSERKFTLDQMRAAIIDLQKGEESVRVVARRHGMDHALLINVRKGRSYKELQQEFPDYIKEGDQRRPYAKTTIRSLKTPNRTTL